MMSDARLVHDSTVQESQLELIRRTSFDPSELRDLQGYRLEQGPIVRSTVMHARWH